MYKVVKYGLIVCMILCAVVVGGFWLLDNADSPKKETKTKVETKVQTASEETKPAKEEEEEYIPAAENMVRKEHKIMNDLVGYGNDYEFDFDSKSHKEDLQLVRDEIQQQAEHANDENLKADFENVVKLIDLGIAKKDVESLDYAHRILHDLDMKMNAYVGTATDVHRFGYSRYDNGEQASNVDHKLQDAQ